MSLPPNLWFLCMYVHICMYVIPRLYHTATASSGDTGPIFISRRSFLAEAKPALAVRLITFGSCYSTQGPQAVMIGLLATRRKAAICDIRQDRRGQDRAAASMPRSPRPGEVDTQLPGLVNTYVHGKGEPAVQGYIYI